MNAHKSTTHKEFFFHIKNEAELEQGRWINTYKAGTVFIREEHPGEWRASVARCSVNDNFCKRTGRSVSRRKYFQDKIVDVDVKDDKPTYDLAESLYMSPEIV